MLCGFLHTFAAFRDCSKTRYIMSSCLPHTTAYMSFNHGPIQPIHWNGMKWLYLIAVERRNLPPKMEVLCHDCQTLDFCHQHGRICIYIYIHIKLYMYILYIYIYIYICRFTMIINNLYTKMCEKQNRFGQPPLLRLLEVWPLTPWYPMLCIGHLSWEHL